MIFLLTVCFNIFNFFVMVKRCVVQFCTDSNKTGHTMQRFPNDTNLKRQLVKLVQVKVADFVKLFEHSVVCSSHFSSWCHTNNSGPTRSKLFRSIETTHSQQTRRIQKWPTKLRKKLSSSKVRGRQRKYKINLHGNLSLIKQQQLYWFAKNLFFFSSNER